MEERTLHVNVCLLWLNLGMASKIKILSLDKKVINNVIFDLQI